MILFLTLIYVAILGLAIKLKWIKQLTLFWKLSPALWMVFLLVALFIPMQFWAPSGSLLVSNYTVPVVSRVAGEVSEVIAKENQPLNKGALLFRIDAVPYQAAFDAADAALTLANIRVEQEQELMDKGVGKQVSLDRAVAQRDQAQAQLDSALYNLKATEVFAPANGYVTNLTLREGARVAPIPLAPAMSFIDTDEHIVGGFIFQNYLRYIQPGQKAEVTFKMYPGMVFDAEVDHIIPARATGLEGIGGTPVQAQQLSHAPFAVRLNLYAEAKALKLPSGATGSMAIYSETGTFTHVIRKVELRLQAIMNFIIPA